MLIKDHAAFILKAIGQQTDPTLAELQATLVERGVGTSIATETGHATEQDRSDVLKRREEWFDGQLDLDPDKPVLIDET